VTLPISNATDLSSVVIILVTKSIFCIILVSSVFLSWINVLFSLTNVTFLGLLIPKLEKCNPALHVHRAMSDSFFVFIIDSFH